MNISSFFSVKDFFNYYIAGLLWILELATIFVPLGSYKTFLKWLDGLQNVTDKMGSLFVGILLIILPYIVGFALTPVSEFFTKKLKKIFGDPKKWITDYSAKTPRHKGERLSQTKIRLVVQKLKEILGDEKTINKEGLDSWFFLIRDYVINSHGEASAHAIRAQDLFNFAESIILPLPLIFITLGVRMYYISKVMGIIFWVLGICFLYLLSRRYLKLRKYWVKHVYNTFLVITSNSPLIKK